ncbi:hypothetical protein GXW82_40845 [Streptacidiphilus sp. 4-A2]|nr:hypothetical protein [Streptacidiphilus sp. 4-A2]
MAASSMAAVAGAVLASELGVYGTILGAAVVSAGATVGSALFQHAFRRTGEQLRDLKSTAATASTPVPFQRPESRPVEPDLFDPFDPGGERTRMLARIAPPQAESVAVYRGRTTWRLRNWKSVALVSVLVFGLAMGTVTAVELIAGKPVTAIVKDEPGSGTTFGGGTVDRSGGSGGGAPATKPSEHPADPGQQPSGRPGGTPGGSPGPTPSRTPDGSPSPTPSSGPSGTPTPGTSPAGVPDGQSLPSGAAGSGQAAP